MTTMMQPRMQMIDAPIEEAPHMRITPPSSSPYVDEMPHMRATPPDKETSSYVPIRPNLPAFAHGGHLKRGRMVQAHMSKKECDILDHLQGKIEKCPRSGMRSYSHLEALLKNPHIHSAVHHHTREHHAMGGGVGGMIGSLASKAVPYLSNLASKAVPYISNLFSKGATAASGLSNRGAPSMANLGNKANYMMNNLSNKASYYGGNMMNPNESTFSRMGRTAGYHANNLSNKANYMASNLGNQARSMGSNLGADSSSWFSHGGHATEPHNNHHGIHGDTELVLIGPHTHKVFHDLALATGGHPHDLVNPYDGKPQFWSLGNTLGGLWDSIKGGASNAYETAKPYLPAVGSALAGAAALGAGAYGANKYMKNKAMINLADNPPMSRDATGGLGFGGYAPPPPIPPHHDPAFSSLRVASGRGLPPTGQPMYTSISRAGMREPVDMGKRVQDILAGKSLPNAAPKNMYNTLTDLDEDSRTWGQQSPIRNPYVS